MVVIVGLLIALNARMKLVANSGRMLCHSYAAVFECFVHIHYSFGNHRILEKTVES